MSICHPKTILLRRNWWQFISVNLRSGTLYLWTRTPEQWSVTWSFNAGRQVCHVIRLECHGRKSLKSWKAILIYDEKYLSTNLFHGQKDWNLISTLANESKGDKNSVEGTNGEELQSEAMTLRGQIPFRSSTWKVIKLASVITSNLLNTVSAPWPGNSKHKWAGSDTLTHLYCGIQMFSQLPVSVWKHRAPADETGRGLEKNKVCCG